MDGFAAYNTTVSNYVAKVEGLSTNTKILGIYNKNDAMRKAELTTFGNALRHALGIGYQVFQGVPPRWAIQAALLHEPSGTPSADTIADKAANAWGAKTAAQILASGGTWQDFVIAPAQAAANATLFNAGVISN